MPLRLVRKVMTIGTETVYPGTLVDVSGWTNLHLLEDMGYVSLPEPKDPEPTRKTPVREAKP